MKNIWLVPIYAILLIKRPLKKWPDDVIRTNILQWRQTALTRSSEDDAGDVGGWSVTFRRFGLHPEVVTAITLKAAQLQVIGPGQNRTFSNINLINKILINNRLTKNLVF